LLGFKKRQSTSEQPERPKFEQLLDDELHDVDQARKERSSTSPPGTGPDLPSDSDLSGYLRAEKMGLLGLAFSGGGIRSATFNLGVLQTLARYRVLERVDYLSTVSGGGYIGGWLAAWIQRNEDGVHGVADRLRESVVEDGAQAGNPTPAEPPEVSYLRKFSNYLTPKRGLSSGDTWSAVGIYVRNLFLNQLILCLLLLSGLLAVRALHAGLTLTSQGVACGVGIVLWVCASVLVTAAADWAPGWVRRPLRGATAVFGAQRGLAAAACVLLSAVFWSRWAEAVPKKAVPSAGLLLLAIAVALGLLHMNDLNRKAWRWPGALAASAGLAALVLSYVPQLFAPWSVELGEGWRRLALNMLFPFENTEGVTIWGAPVALLVFSLGGALYTGLMSNQMETSRREWWGRFGGMAAALSLGWVVVTLIALAGPFWVDTLTDRGSLSLIAAFLVWAAPTASGLFVGQSAATGGLGRPRYIDLLATAAPYVFIVGLLIALSRVGVWATMELGPSLPFAGKPWGPPLMCALAAGGVSVLLTWWIDVNVFSFHMFYRNRLARCYQGGANPVNRQPDRFHGFAASDDEFKLSDLRQTEMVDGKVRRRSSTKPGPYLLVNSTLNLVAGKNLAWQKRKGASFFLAPQYCGFGGANKRPTRSEEEVLNAFRPTERYGGGIRLSSAVAVSGAAASPNMGYHSSAPLAFLMTMFNLRLGWWTANPRKGAWESTGPQLGLVPLLAELFGFSNASRDFVYLSDGGHFENLGIYELVRRRCRFIVACDAEADGEFQFDGLGNAIEKCRTDFGVDIRIDTNSIRKAGDTEQDCRHCAVGAIDYGDGFSGILLYVKSSVTGDEPADVARYRAQNPDFPHQSTGDQWFDETQFESYRRLGQHAMESVLAAAVERKDVEAMPMQELFVRLRRHWHAPSRRDGGAFTRHSQRFAQIMADMAADKNLRFLDKQFNPSWHYAEGREAVSKDAMVVPDAPEKLRAGYYLCRRLIQLMEDVFIDLQLDQEYAHPDNHGWMNLFRNWSYAGVFRLTWAVTASTYGARFQDFCARRLKLSAGEVQAGRTETVFRNFTAGPQLAPPESLPAELNFHEKAIAQKVIALYFRTEARESPEVRVVRTEIEAATSRGDTVSLPVGFAVLTPDGGELVYLRIQDHLWSMGLGGRAIHELGVQRLYLPIMKLEEKGEPKVLPTPEDFERFRQLFEEAKAPLTGESAATTGS